MVAVTPAADGKALARGGRDRRVPGRRQIIGAAGDDRPRPLSRGCRLTVRAPHERLRGAHATAGLAAPAGPPAALVQYRRAGPEQRHPAMGAGRGTSRRLRRHGHRSALRRRFRSRFPDRPIVGVAAIGSGRLCGGRQSGQLILLFGDDDSWIAFARRSRGARPDHRQTVARRRLAEIAPERGIVRPVLALPAPGLADASGASDRLDSRLPRFLWSLDSELTAKMK